MHTSPSAWKIAQGTVRGFRRRKKEIERIYIRLEIEIFAASQPQRGWKQVHERKRDSARFISLYIVHCNYNLYLLVIDTFIDRLLPLVASVISQAQISETGEPRERHTPFPAISSCPIFVTNAQLPFLDSLLLYARYRCEQAYRTRCS